MAENFIAQLEKFNLRSKEKLDEIDVRSKLAIANFLVSNTRIARPETWNPPNFNHIPGAMRGNWRIGGVFPFEPERRNQTLKIRAEEAAKIPATIGSYMRITNTTPYLPIYEQKDAMIAKTMAAFRQIIHKVIVEVASSG